MAVGGRGSLSTDTASIGSPGAGPIAALCELAERAPVVLAGRPHHMSLSRTYRSAGSEGDLLGRGLLSAGALSAWQSRILLLVGLACGYGRADLAAALDDAGVP